VISVAWLAVSFEVVVAGSLLQADAAGARAVLALFQWALALTPVWSLALDLALGQSLLRPLDLPGPGAARFRRGPRALGVFLTGTAVLPLGGLAIPLWIYVRHHLWPGYARQFE